MYGIHVVQHLFFSCLVLVSLPSCLQGSIWNGNDNKVSPTCHCEKKTRRDDSQCRNRFTRQMRNEVQKCMAYCPKAMFFSGTTNGYAKYNAGSKPGTTVSNGGLDAITSCFWINAEETTDIPAVLSYAVPTDENEFTIFLISGNITVYLKYIAIVRTRVEVSVGEWNHFCVTWKSSDGSVETYKNGVSRNKQTGHIVGETIKPSGIWIIGQDQDTFGGGFKENNAFHGSLASVNVWNRILDASEISTLGSQKCGLGMQGNYIAFKEFDRLGDVQMVKPSCCYLTAVLFFEYFRSK